MVHDEKTRNYIANVSQQLHARSQYSGVLDKSNIYNSRSDTRSEKIIQSLAYSRLFLSNKPRNGGNRVVVFSLATQLCSCFSYF